MIEELVLRHLLLFTLGEILRQEWNEIPDRVENMKPNN